MEHTPNAIPVVEIRKATQCEIQTVDKINRISLAENYSMDEWRYLSENANIFIAIVENMVVGYICTADLNLFLLVNSTELTKKFILDNGYHLSTFSNGKIMCIVSFAVLPEHRNKKIGDKLLKFVLNSDIHFILNVRISNTSAQRLYVKHGFYIFEGLDKNYYDNPSEDAYLMCKKKLIV